MYEGDRLDQHLLCAVVDIAHIVTTEASKPEIWPPPAPPSKPPSSPHPTKRSPNSTSPPSTTPKDTATKHNGSSTAKSATAATMDSRRSSYRPEARRFCQGTKNGWTGGRQVENASS